MTKRLWSKFRTFLAVSCVCLLLFLLVVMIYRSNGFGPVETITSLHNVTQDGTTSCIQGGKTSASSFPEQICIDNALTK